jgi:prepilin-type processing-associated H-X9-DG protein
MAEKESVLTGLDRTLDHAETKRLATLRDEIDTAESRCAWDWTFRRQWERSHPGRINSCMCDGHKAYRGETL